jgi:hypothetical protein
MIWLAVGFLLLGLMLGGAGMRRVGSLVGRTWRPQAGVLAIAAFIGSAALGVREAWAPAIVLFLIGLALSMSARRVKARHRPAGSAPGPRPMGRMSREEAGSILGVSPDASAEDVQEAYLRLIRRAHPDQGGTSGLAAQLNAARDTLLGKS